MDLADETLDNIDKNRLESDYIDKAMLDHYYPGTMYVKLLSYDGKLAVVDKITKLNHLDFVTVGDFFDFFKDKKLHEMSFMGYGVAWKGCRHFISAQTFLQLRNMNDVSTIDQEGQMLGDSIKRVRHGDSGNHDKTVDRGMFLTYVSIYPANFVGAHEVED